MPTEADVQHAAPRSIRWIAVAGPPAVGKTFLAKGLAKSLSASVFSLRAFARACGAQRLPVDVALDPRGEYADPVIDGLLRDAFLHDGFPTGGQSVVLPDFPRTPTHLMLLHSVARTLNVPLTVLELDAANADLMARSYHRRLCLACVQDPDGGPHELPFPDQHMPIRCDTCAGPLHIRCADRPAVFMARLTRYRQHRPALRAAADTARIPWVQIRATDSSAALKMALRLLAVPAAAVLAERDRGAVDGIPQQRPRRRGRPGSP